MNEPEALERLLERYSNISRNPEALERLLENEIQQWMEAINEIPLDNNEEDNLKTEENEIDEDEEDEMIKILQERKRQRKLRNKIERKKIEVNADLDRLLSDQKIHVKSLERRHEEEIRDLEKALRRKQTDEVAELKYKNEQEREAMIKKSQNCINTLLAELNWSKVQSKKYKSIKRKFVEEENKEDEIPECPVCLVEMIPPKKIFQCLEGHLVCSDCRPKVNPKGCVTCRNESGYTSRSRFIEDLVQKRIKSD